jgi:glycosyltransferase involved in cell wall biosynthesis
MKVVHSITSLDLSAGGPSRSLPNICIGLKDQGLEQQIITYNSKRPNIDKLRFENIDVQFVSSDRKKDKLGLGFKREIQKIKGDLFHLHNLWSPILHWTANYCYNNNIPYIMSPRGTLEPWPLSQKKIKKKLFWHLFQKQDLIKANCIHTTSIMEAMNIRELGVKTPIAIIPNGINTENYPYLKSGESKEKILLFLSRVSPKKGIENLIDAWTSIPDRNKKNWKVRIVGEGDTGDNDVYFSRIRNLIESKGLSHSIILVGPKYGKDKIEEYKNASLFILPTYSENFGMVIAEAMISGVPVITTTGTPWKILKEKNIGWWIKLSKENLISAIIEAVSLSDEQRIEKGILSRNYILKNYSIDGVAKKYKQLYEWATDNTKPMPDFVFSNSVYQL